MAYNANVQRIQQALLDMHYRLPQFGADGWFGNETETALNLLIQNNGSPLATVSTKRPPWIIEGMKVFGLHETKDNAKLRKWLKSDGKTLGDPDALPWCGDFVETAIKLGLPDEPFPGALGVNPYWARNWTKFGKHCDPYMYSIGVFERGSGGHVGFLVGDYGDGNYAVFGGNQSDKVGVVPIAKRRLLDTRCPITWNLEPIPLVPLKRNQAVSVNEI